MSNRYVLTLPLTTETWQEHRLCKRFEIARYIYNACLGQLLKQYKKLKNDPIYTALLNQEKSKIRNTQLNELNKTYGLSEYALHSYVKYMNRHYKENIDSNTAQKIATRVFKAFEKYRFGNAKKVYFKSSNELDSVEGKTNISGIRFKDDCIYWLNLKIPVKVKTHYERYALRHKIKYCRILKKEIRSKTRFFVQLILEGSPLVKREIEQNNNAVGLDIGTQTIAVVSNTDVKLLELAPNIQTDEAHKRKLLRKLDRQRRHNNPNKYSPDGTNKKNRKQWIFSQNYKKTKSQLAELQRKIAVKRRLSHIHTANYILSLGTNIKVETMSIQGLQKRSKETGINPDTGRFKRKKRFGKSIGNKAPAMLLDIIDIKLKYIDKKLRKINTYKVKASQYNHFDNTYTKKSLSQRWNYFDDFKIQRDLYSAFLIMNVDDTLENIDRELCQQTFNHFKKLHDAEIVRLQQNSNTLSSIGI